MNEMPGRMRQYSAFQYVQASGSEPAHPGLEERCFKGEALKADLRGVEVGSEFNFWDVDLKKFENPAREIITVAQGEMALEELLKQFKKTWSSYGIELVNYQDKCRLIKGWDELFAQVL
ncbi:hypothetical protein HDV00_009053 [Rhizophlyctis rosea]|nr:hypothetical protein HDV00_009053 [Rhizophlyctis rosea]